MQLWVHTDGLLSMPFILKCLTLLGLGLSNQILLGVYVDVRCIHKLGLALLICHSKVSQVRRNHTEVRVLEIR